jgi:hypothetical protein
MAFSFKNLTSNVLPAGIYQVVLDDIKFKTSSSGESTQNLVCVFKVAKGPHAGRTLVHTIYEKAFSFRLGGFLRAAEVDMNKEFTTVQELYEYGIKAAKGKQLNIEVTIRPYNGVDYNDVAKFMPMTTSSTSAKDIADAFSDVKIPAKTPKTKEEVVDEDLPSFKDDLDI